MILFVIFGRNTYQRESVAYLLLLGCSECASDGASASRASRVSLVRVFQLPKKPDPIADRDYAALTSCEPPRVVLTFGCVGVHTAVEVMRIWLRSVVDTILGRVSGKTSRPDTATRMAMDADFSCRLEPMLARAPRRRGQDDGPPTTADALADADFLEELIRIVNEAQKVDAEDERRLYDPTFRNRPSSFQRRRPDRQLR